MIPPIDRPIPPSAEEPRAKSAFEAAAERAARYAEAAACGAGAPLSSPASAEPGAPALGELLQRLAEREEAIAKLEDQSLRARADYENSRKRLQRDKEDAVRFANSGLLEKLLPVVDSFELGLAEARRNEAAAPIAAGFELVAKQLQDFLRDQGVEAVPAEGVEFDPNVHEALGQLPSAEIPEGHVVQAMRRGYTLRERLLRPALVWVSKGAGE